MRKYLIKARPKLSRANFSSHSSMSCLTAHCIHLSLGLVPFPLWSTSLQIAHGSAMSNVLRSPLQPTQASVLLHIVASQGSLPTRGRDFSATCCLDSSVLWKRRRRIDHPLMKPLCLYTQRNGSHHRVWLPVWDTPGAWITLVVALPLRYLLGAENTGLPFINQKPSQLGS